MRSSRTRRSRRADLVSRLTVSGATVSRAIVSRALAHARDHAGASRSDTAAGYHPRAHAPLHMQVLSLRHSRPARDGYGPESGVTPYAQRKAQKIPSKKGKGKGEVKADARSKTKAGGHHSALNLHPGPHLHPSSRTLHRRRRSATPAPWPTLTHPHPTSP